MAEIICNVRAFVAIKLENAILEKIACLCAQMQKKATSRSIRWVKTDQIHLTLRFYGDIPRPQIPTLLEKLRPIAYEIAPFRLCLGGLGCFPDYRNPRIIWIGLNGDLSSLMQAQRRIIECSSDFGSHVEGKEFKPHLTLARIKEASRIEGQQIGELVQKHPVNATGDWVVDRLCLIQSVLTPQGPIYTELGCIPFNQSS